MSNDQPLSRPRYFTGRLLTAKDLEEEQNYFLEKHRRHNRWLHGYGTVWGLHTSVEGNVDQGQSLIISPGLAIDRCGNEILVPSTQMKSLPAEAEITAVRLTLCYKEITSEIVPVPGSPGNGESTQAAEIIESFQLCLGTQEEASCVCPDQGVQSLELAHLVKAPSGWSLDRTFLQPRLKRYDEKMVWIAVLIGASAGAVAAIFVRRH